MKYSLVISFVLIVSGLIFNFLNPIGKETQAEIDISPIVNNISSANEKYEAFQNNKKEYEDHLEKHLNDMDRQLDTLREKVFRKNMMTRHRVFLRLIESHVKNWVIDPQDSYKERLEISLSEYLLYLKRGGAAGTTLLEFQTTLVSYHKRAKELFSLQRPVMAKFEIEVPAMESKVKSSGVFPVGNILIALGSLGLIGFGLYSRKEKQTFKENWEKEREESFQKEESLLLELEETKRRIPSPIAMPARPNELYELHIEEKSQEGLQQNFMAIFQSFDEKFKKMEEQCQEVFQYLNKNENNVSQIVDLIREIEDKTKVINDIVFQTKLLSFNASVEAARAGEYGKGFSVVAEEVGNLAEMSGHASKEIEGLLSHSISQVENLSKQNHGQVSGFEGQIQNEIEDLKLFKKRFHELFSELGQVERQKVEVDISNLETYLLVVENQLEELNKRVEEGPKPQSFKLVS